MKYLSYLLLGGNLTIIFYFWWQRSGQLIGSSLPETLLSFASLSGLLAVFFVLLQFLMAGRTYWIERIFGLDRLLYWHHLNGFLSLLFIVLHPLLLLTAYSMLTGNSLTTQLLIFLQNEDLIKAAIAFVIFLTIVVLSYSMVMAKLKYELWFFIHLLTYVAVIFAFSHQLELGGDFSQQAFVIYWYFLYAFVAINFLIFRFGKQLLSYARHQFFVAHIVPESDEVTSIYIGGKAMENFKVNPGQFLMLRFLTPGRFYQSHPFSLSKVTKGSEIRVSVKNSGDFTSTIGQIMPHTHLLIDGPYGIFGSQDKNDRKLLYIAGGIGITPLRSLLEYNAPQGKDIVLLYVNKTYNEAVFKNELATIAKEHPHIKIIYICTEDETFKGEQGRLDEEKVKRLVPDVTERTVFLCGPPAMMKATRALLIALGVKNSKIHFEKFSLG